MASNLQIMYAGGGRRRTAPPPPDTKKLAEFLARMREAAPTALDEDTPPAMISGDPSYAASSPELAAMGIQNPTRQGLPGGVPGIALPPPDPLRREIPQAPDVPDLSAIDAEEAAKLEAEQGPRVKPNPKGWKGVLLGAVKGLVGLAEGYGRSGARDWHDAVPSMVEGASRRISDYQTNREDTVPFDEERTRRVQERVRPLLQKYGQDKERYGTEMDRYKLGTEEERHGEERADKDRAFGMQERQLNSLDQYRQDQIDERRDAARLRSETARESARERVRLGIQTQRNAQMKGQQAARLKHLDGQARRLDTQERQLITELENLQKEKSRPKLQGDSGTIENINAQYAAVNGRLDAIRQQRDALDDQYGSLAEETATAEAGGAPAAGITPEVRAQGDTIKKAYRAGTMTREQAVAALRALGLQ